MADNSIVLKVNNLSKSFGGIKAVQNVDFELKTNEIYGIIGPNGAGKSTIFNLITGYYKPDSGSVIFDGKQLVGLTPDRVCLLGITRTFQIARPFGNLTVFDNVMIGLLCKSKTVQDARINCGKILERTKLSHKARSLGSDLTT
jgi:branched-chain amino acid transport system ATP-binding protein